MQKKTEHSEIQINDDILDNIADVLKSKKYIKIGVLGKSAARGGNGPSNVELAATHEFGKPSEHIPQRSFLRLTANTAHDKFQALVDGNADAILKAIAEARWPNVLEQFGAAWVGYVTETFEAQGYGHWPPLSIVTLLNRKNPAKLNLKQIRETSKILQDTGALLRSIMYEVKDE